MRAVNLRTYEHTKKRNNNSPISIFVVDNELPNCNTLKEILEKHGYKVRCFADISKCIKAVCRDECDLLISKVEMPKTDGIELLKEIKQIRPYLPVLLTTETDNINIGFGAAKEGALAVLEEPIDAQSLIPQIDSALAEREFDPLLGNSLTKVETRIAKMVVDGKCNKEIAHLLHRSVRTIEWHRNRMMRKLGIDNVVDLVKIAMRSHENRKITTD
jgi:FixJ family two-component response regulator